MIFVEKTVELTVCLDHRSLSAKKQSLTKRVVRLKREFKEVQTGQSGQIELRCQFGRNLFPKNFRQAFFAPSRASDKSFSIL